MADDTIKEKKTRAKKTAPASTTKISKKAAAIGAPFPNVTTYFSGKRTDIKLLEQTARAPPVARSLWQLQLIAFPWFDFKIIPPSDEDDVDEDQNKELLNKLEEIERRIQTTIMCSQAMYDIITYGSAVFELTWKSDEDGYVVPDVVQRLPAQSFRTTPAGASNKNAYIVGNILKGIVFNKADNKYEFYQIQDSYSSGTPVQIPTEQIIHIKDNRTAYVDGEPYLLGITSTIAQLEFVRKRVMQTASRIGAPKQVATVGIPPEYLKALEANKIPVAVTSAVPGVSGGTAADSMLTDLWDLARTVVENQNSDIAVAVPNGIKLDWERPSIPFNPTEIDAYLIKEAIYHIFPRDILEVAAQAISTTSSPLLELLKMMVQGWQSICTIQFENLLWNKFLEYNGFEGYRIEIEWASLIPPDQQKIESMAMAQFNLHTITLNECRTKMGLPPLDPAPWMDGLSEREILEKEISLWRTGQLPQEMGAGGMGGDMFGGMDMGGEEESLPEETGEEIDYLAEAEAWLAQYGGEEEEEEIVE